MAVDKNLFLYDLAVVAIMKNEAPYLQEWLDYHLLAGVDHFYIYDNEDSDAQLKVLQPYIERGLVTHIPFQGKTRQMEAYNDAVKKYKFFCRYMAFIDGDEFIFPQNDKKISEVIDEIIGDNPYLGAVSVYLRNFGSSNNLKADYNRGVLERFTHRAPQTANAVKSVANPRTIKFMNTPHFPVCFTEIQQITEPLEDKIVINHYVLKSLEEYLNRNSRGDAFYSTHDYTEEGFHEMDNNEVFDDGILKYYTSRQLETGGGIDPIKFFSAITGNLSAMFLKNSPAGFFANKIETFMTCRKLAAFLRENGIEDSTATFLEETSLKAIHRTMFTKVQLFEIEMILDELPEILALNYPVVEEIRQGCVILATEVRNYLREEAASSNWMLWNLANEWDKLIDMINALKYCVQK